jgi:two-component system response regulator MprA
MAPHTTRVLLVEDTDALRHYYSRVLRFQGFEVREACNGLEALDRLHDEEPDLVLTDIMMPVLDGLELIRRIRSMGELPVVAVTGSGAEVERQARDAGADDVLAKPVQLDALLGTLAHFQDGVGRGCVDA